MRLPNDPVLSYEEEEELRRRQNGPAPTPVIATPNVPTPAPTTTPTAPTTESLLSRVGSFLPTTNVLTKGVLGLVDIAGRRIAEKKAGALTSEDEANAKRLNELRRMEELDALGLSQQEKDAFFSRADAQLYGQGLEASQRRGQALATSGARGGQALVDAALIDATQMGARQQAEASILAADANAAAAQRQEIARLSKAQNDKLNFQQELRGENIAKTTGGLIDAVTSTLDEQGTLDRDELNRLMERTGMDKKTARAYLRAKNVEYQRSRRKPVNDEDLESLVAEGASKGGN